MPASAQVRVRAPAPLDALLSRYLQVPSADARDAALEAFARDARRTVSELLATEGYFSPGIDVRATPGELSVSVVPGLRTVVSSVSVDIRGPLTDARRAALVAAWPLERSKPFRDVAWREAKQVVLRQLLDVDFPSASLLDSQAEIDPANATAALSVAYDSGPRTVFGDLRISGLSRYSPALVKRYSHIEPGAPYRQKDVLDLQSALQATPYFASVSVGLADPEEGESAALPGSRRVPVTVHVQENPPHRVSFGAGVSSDTGGNGEVIYQGIDFLHRGWQLDAGLRFEQLRQRLYADVRLPPVGNRRDSFGSLAEREDIEGLERRRIALAAVRDQRHGEVDGRYTLKWQREIERPKNAEQRSNTALTLDGNWTLRRVDNLLDPRRGFVAQFQAGGGSKALLSEQNFLRLYARYQHFFPVAERDVVTLRGELGATLASSRAGIPGEFLFRTGGAQSVRGYSYQSLGVKEGSAVVGGRYLTTMSAEYTHWLNNSWGAAAFIDAGDASDQRQDLSLAVGYGVGARWKSPAGPLAVDLAYGDRDGRFRIHFSLAVAF